MNNNPLIAKQFNPFVRKSSASPLSSLADTNLNTVQEPQAETPGTESESGPEPEAVTDQTNQNQPETPVDAAAEAAPTDAPAAPVADAAPSPAAAAAPVSAEEAKAPVQEDTANAPQAQQAASSDASGHQSRRHRRLN